MDLNKYSGLLAILSFIFILAGLIISNISYGSTFLILHLADILIFIAVILDAIKTLDIGDTIKFFVLSFTIGLIMELSGVLYGIPFGEYHYTKVIGLKIFGLVPLAIPLNWFLITYIAFKMTNGLIGYSMSEFSILNLIALAILDGLIATSWDLIIDPVMVHIIRAWVWETSGGIYGIPISNFVGWFIVSFIITLL